MPGYGAGMAALISASPFFTHLVAVAPEVHDWESCGPGAAAAVVTVVVTVVGAGWDGTGVRSAVAIGAAPMATAAAAAAAAAANVAVMCFNPMRMVAPLLIRYPIFLSRTDLFSNGSVLVSGCRRPRCPDRGRQ